MNEVEIIIKVDGKVETHRVAMNVNDENLYRVKDRLQNTQWFLEHSYSQGANALARKILIRPKAGVITGTK
jgi:hypothetical protein